MTASKEYTDANNTLQAMKRYPRPEWSERSAQIVKMDKKHKALQDVETAIAKEPNSAASHQDLHGERDEAEDGDTLWNNVCQIILQHCFQLLSEKETDKTAWTYL